VKASQFLSISLANIQKNAQDEINKGNEQAIQDAINLNNLLDQRIALTATYEKQLFDLQNADSVERRQAGVVDRADQIKTLTDTYNKQKDALDTQISLIGQKVAMERQIFDLASDTASLQAQSNAAAILALQTQIDQWTTLKGIIGSITLGPNGLYGGSPIPGTAPSNSPTINVTVNGGNTNTDTGNVVADAVTKALDDAARQADQ